MAPTVCICCAGKITPATANSRNPNVCLTCEQLLEDIYPESAAELLKLSLETDETEAHRKVTSGEMRNLRS